MSSMPVGAAVQEHARTAPRTEAPARVLQPFQIRVIEEKRDLDAWVERLGQFIVGPQFKALEPLERARMRKQLQLMCELSTVLGARIAAFGGGS